MSNPSFTGWKYGFRSGLEQVVANQLEAAGIQVRYEHPEDVIRYKVPEKVSRYTPDFVLIKRNGEPLIIETKGRFLTADRQKHLLIKNQFNFDIRFVFSSSRQKIGKGSKTTYAMWCEKYGFQYADKLIPEAWLKE